MTIRLPYARPWIEDDDIEAVAETLRGQFLSQGPNMAALEAELCALFGVGHAVVCNSGTAALHLVYMALELGPERGLVTTPVTFLATANTARMCGATVAFADTDSDTGNLTAAAAEAALDAADFPVGALTAVHLAGRPCDMPALRKLAETRGVALVEDACHAPLARYHDYDDESHVVGACTHSDAAILSFHAIKHMAMGEGGAVLTNDPVIAARARRLRNHGIIREADEWQDPPEPEAPWYYEMHDLGWNYRASELQCALGRTQLAKLEAGIVRRREIAGRYQEHLGNLPYLRCPPWPRFIDGHAWHLYPIAIDFEALHRTRGEVMRALADAGIGTQVHYIPLYKQPYYAADHPAPLAGAERYYAQTLSIPMYAGLSDDDVDDVVAAIRAVLLGGDP